MQPNPAQMLIDAVGHEVLRDALGLTDRNIRHARSVGYFAAQWYAPMKVLAESRGVFCPLDAFNFKPVAKLTGNGSHVVQAPVNTQSKRRASA